MLFHYLLFCKTHARTSIKAPASANPMGYDFRLCTCMLKLWAQRTEELLTLQQEALLGQCHHFTACEVQRPVGGSPGAEP